MSTSNPRGHLLAVLVFALTVMAALAQPASSETRGQIGPFRVGMEAPFDSVQKAYDDARLVKITRPFGRVTLGLHASADGLWFFFDSDKRLDNIRMDAPFASPIRGVRIGDTQADVFATLGRTQIRTWKFGTDDAYLYPFDCATSLRVDIGRGRVVRMFLLKQKAGDCQLPMS